jgi:NAD(P)-dependent dehydrogenase (short-subunit alcohol dehydrogenase family)
MRTVEGKIAFITGGVSGIGLGIAETLLAGGAKVVVTYLQASHLTQAMGRFGKAKNRVHAIRLDVTDREAFERAASETERVFGNPQILCNNAGVNLLGPIDEATFEDWDWVLDVNLRGVINGLVTFIPRMRQQKEGHIVNIASMAAFLPCPDAGPYTASKFAVRGLSEALRYRLAPHGIGVSVVCPGLVNTEIYDAERNRHASNEQRVKRQNLKKIFACGMSPTEVGGKTMRAILQNDLYVFTHPEFRQDLQQRFEQVLAAVPEEIPTPVRLAVLKAFRQSLSINFVSGDSVSR